MHRHVLVLSGLLLAALALPGGSALADDLSACTASAPTALSQRIASCSRVIASDRAPPAAYLARGQAYRMKADYGDAIEDFDAVIDMDAAPALTAEALLGRGAAFAARGKLRKAIADLGRALDIGLPPGRQAAAVLLPRSRSCRCRGFRSVGGGLRCRHPAWLHQRPGLRLSRLGQCRAR